MRNKDYRAMLLISAGIGTVLSIAAFIIDIRCGIICLVLSVGIILTFALYTKKRYKKIEELNDYLSLVCSGDYSINIEENAEGELSILQNNLYKVVVMLKSSNEALKYDKVYLADSLADITHQLKTPLTSMMVMTDLLRDNPDEESREKFVGIIESQLDKMKWLIATLLKLSKLDADTAEFNKTDLIIDDVINTCLTPFELTIELKNIKVEKQLNGFRFSGDKNWTVEAIENVIKNCIEHTDSGGKICIKTFSTSIYNQLTISDNGCGIEKEDLPHIFERFYHGKNSNSDSVGIGLALAKEIFAKENATITAESESRVGTCFTIRFYKSII